MNTCQSLIRLLLPLVKSDHVPKPDWIHDVNIMDGSVVSWLIKLCCPSRFVEEEADAVKSIKKGTPSLS